MKSRIRNTVVKKIIGINIAKEKSDIIDNIAKGEGAEAVFYGSDIGGQSVGYLCSFRGFDRTDNEVAAINDECLIFSGIDSRGLDPILKKLREKGASVELKAIVTAHNQRWSAAELVKELKREHEHMNGGKGNEK